MKIKANKSYIIVEGIFALYWQEIRKFFDITVFVDVDDETCLSRRLTRDVNQRNRTQKSVFAQYNQTVRPMFIRYVQPTKQFADLTVDGKQPVELSAQAIIEFIEKNS